MAVQQLKVKFSTDGIDRVRTDAARATKSYVDFLNRAEAAMKAADKAAIDAAGNTEKLVAAEASRQKAAQQANRAIAASYRELRVKSEADITQQKNQAISAFEALKKSGVASASDIARANQALTQRLKELDRQLESTESHAKKAGGGFSIFKGAVATALGVGAVQAVQAVTNTLIGFGRQSVQASTDFQGFRDQLQLVEGSASGAQRTLDRLDKFAAKTPAELNEVVNAYIKLGNRGIKPTNKDLIAMLDLAKSQRKSLDQLVEAALDAQTGEFERLKEFGIRGSKSGDQVTLSFGKTSKTVANTAEAIQGALVSLGQIQGVAGSSEKAMQRLDGQFSNFNDNLTRIERGLGDALEPIASGILGGATEVLGEIADPAIWQPLKDAFADLSTSLLEATGGATGLKDLLVGPVRDAVIGVAAVVREFSDYLKENPATIQQIADGLAGIMAILGPIAGFIAFVLQKTAEGWINIARLIGVVVEVTKDWGVRLTNAQTTIGALIDLARLINPPFNLVFTTVSNIVKTVELVIKGLAAWGPKIIEAMNPLEQFKKLLGGVMGFAGEVGTDIGKSLGEKAKSVTSGSGGPLLPAPGGAFSPDKFPITSPMGMRNGRMHAGTDYGTPEGTPLANIWGAARVTYAGWAGGYGNMVELTMPDGRRIVLGHLSRINVSAGQVVPPGALLGLTGNTGRSTGPHLHLEDHPGTGGPLGSVSSGSKSSGAGAGESFSAQTVTGDYQVVIRSADELINPTPEVDQKLEDLIERLDKVRLAIIRVYNEKLKLKTVTDKELNQLRELDERISKVVELRDRDRKVAELQAKAEEFDRRAQAAAQRLDQANSNASAIGSARGELTGLQADAAETVGNVKLAEQLRQQVELEALLLQYRQQRQQLGIQLFAAEATGNAEATAALREQIFLLDQINQVKLDAIAAKYDSLKQRLTTIAQGIAESVSGGVQEIFNGLLDGTKSFGDTLLGAVGGILKNIGQQFLSFALQMLQQAIFKQLLGLFGGLFGGGGFGGGFFGGATGAGAIAGNYATGGLIRGPGTDTSDSVLAKLSRNEYVVRAKSVKAVGIGFMDRLNGMAAGGDANQLFDGIGRSIYHQANNISNFSRFPEGPVDRGGGDTVNVKMTVITPNPDGFRPSERQMGQQMSEQVKRGLKRR